MTPGAYDAVPTEPVEGLVATRDGPCCVCGSTGPSGATPSTTP